MGRHEQGVNTSGQRWQTIPRALCFITIDDAQGHDVLLLRGAPTKRIWPDRLNGVGGHIERDEDIAAAARREIREETGLAVSDLLLRGVVQIDAGQPVGVMMFVWTARAAGRAVTPCAEGALEWHPVDRLPTADLVEDLAQLLPRVLAMGPADPPWTARYWYDKDDRLHCEWGPGGAA